MPSEYRKFALLLLLLVPCVWLVRRNLFPPASPAASDARTAAPGARSGQDRALAAAVGERSAAPRPGKQRKQVLDVDPSLRLDLLEASRSVIYQGSSRNIFEYPSQAEPLPVAPAPPVTPPGDESATQTPAPPKSPSLPWKFYGTAQQSGGPRRAFLTDGEEILIAKEGEIVAKFYKINRIGVSSLELEDTRSSEKQQLALIEE
ncbi:MAG: hypothetical protein A3H94_03795 [Acidobacteria bacterium RIFCSPLOWO2_02_FULL_60_20]|nr:MAG: hypothetical protein A3H94_03795 [Acidobacteria bacterium RIFCSPLOWO2_02_FULL_60_20]